MVDVLTLIKQKMHLAYQNLNLKHGIGVGDVALQTITALSVFGLLPP